MNSEYRLSKELKLGVATASTQIEGGFSDSNWNDWYQQGMIKDGTDPQRANAHYKRYREDIDLMADMGLECYRMSLEWSRLEPQQGHFDQAVMNHYIDEISYVQSKGIEVLLTLHHFNNPMWFERIGGFLNTQSPDLFLEFVSFVVTQLGNLVSEYVTINEPNVYVTSAFYFGEFPPGHNSLSDCRMVFTNLAKAHIKAYQAIHHICSRMGKEDTKVGYASHLRVFEANCKYSPVDILGAKLMKKMFQVSIDECCLTGVSHYPLHKDSFFTKGKYYDFIGINYYARSMVSCFRESAKKNAEHNDMGWEIYPKGLEQVIKEYSIKYHAPIYITENGIADRDDKKRAKFLYDHLKVISQLGPCVKKYFHWTFIDNFEWMDGESERFGLVALDYETQKRTVRESGRFYSEIIKHKRVTNEMIQQYIKD